MMKAHPQIWIKASPYRKEIKTLERKKIKENKLSIEKQHL